MMINSSGRHVWANEFKRWAVKVIGANREEALRLPDRIDIALLRAFAERRDSDERNFKTPRRVHKLEDRLLCVMPVDEYISEYGLSSDLDTGGLVGHANSLPWVDRVLGVECGKIYYLAIGDKALAKSKVI